LPAQARGRRQPLPRLEVSWALVGKEHVSEKWTRESGRWTTTIQMMVGFLLVLKLCRDDECAAVPEGGVTVSCKTEECWRFVEGLLGGGKTEAIITLTSMGELESILPARIPEVEEVIRDTGAFSRPLPGCLPTSGMEIGNFLSSAPWIGDPGRRWKLFLFDGGLVVATWDLKRAAAICARPECDLGPCRMLLERWLPKPLVDAILDAAADREAWGLARENPAAFLSSIAARAAGGEDKT